VRELRGRGGQRSAAGHTYQYGTTRQTKERKEKAQEKEALMAWVDRPGMPEVLTISKSQNNAFDLLVR